METGDLTDEELAREAEACDDGCTCEVYRMVRELRRRRATEDFLRGFAAGLTRSSPSVSQALLRILDGGAS